jgi:hypothetical protein
MENAQANKHAYTFARTVEAWVKQNIFNDFVLHIKLDWSSRRTSSRGGLYIHGPGINIAMMPAWPNNQGEVYRFYEYKSYDANKTIGGFYSTEPQHKLEAIILHEIAHAIQFVDYKKNNYRCSPHGPVFKKFYTMLRQEFLNDRLPDQTLLETNYCAFVNKLLSHNLRLVNSKTAIDISKLLI